MKVAFDIGGVISRYPVQMREMMYALKKGGCEVFIVTDMNPEDAMAVVVENGLLGFVGANTNSRHHEYVISADWSRHGDTCKSIVMAAHDIDILIDDRPDYCASGPFIGLVLSPRPEVPYYAAEWSNRSTPTVCVPPEEYEEFQRWRSQR